MPVCLLTWLSGDNYKKNEMQLSILAIHKNSTLFYSFISLVFTQMPRASKKSKTIAFVDLIQQAVNNTPQKNQRAQTVNAFLRVDQLHSACNNLILKLIESSQLVNFLDNPKATPANALPFKLFAEFLNAIMDTVSLPQTFLTSSPACIFLFHSFADVFLIIFILQYLPHVQFVHSLEI